MKRTTNERTWQSYSPLLSDRSSHSLKLKRRSTKLDKNKIAETSTRIDQYHGLLTQAIAELATEGNIFSLIIADINALLAYTNQHNFAPAQRLSQAMPSALPVSDLLAEQKQQLLAKQELTPESVEFEGLNNLIEQLETIQEALKSPLPVLAKKTKGLIKFYRSAQTAICNAATEDRESLLSPTATIGFKNIGTKIARQLLCFDRFGRTFKENESGQHEVKEYLGLYFKRNPRGDIAMDAEDSYLDQGMAYLMESLYHVFSDELICAPTELVKIAHVPVTPKDPNDIAPYSVQDGYVERVAQVGFGIEGIAFDQFLRMIHELQEFSTRFGGEKLCSMLNGWRDQKTLMTTFLEKYSTFNRLIEAFTLLNKIKKEDSYAEEDSILDIINNRNLSNDQDFVLLQYELAELQGLTLDKFEHELRQQLITATIPVLESTYSRLDENLRPSKVDPGLVKHWLGTSKGIKFIETLALCEYSPELLSNPKQGLDYYMFLPGCINHINTLFKKADSKTVLEEAPKLFEKFDDESLCVMMFVHLIARINDAKADNLRVKIIWQGEQLILRLVDIDSDRALANMLYYAPSKRSVKKTDGSNEFEKVTIDHHYTGFKSVLFLVDAFLDRPVNKAVREKLLSAPAVLFVLIWLNKLNAHTLDGQEKIAQNLFSEHDLFENGIPSLELLLKVAPDILESVTGAICKLQDILRTDDQITLREVFSRFDPIISSYYTMLQQENPVTQDACARLYTFTPSIEDMLTKHDPKHPFTEILNQHKNCRAEFSRELRTSSIPDVTRKFVDNYSIDHLTESELLEYVDLIGFPYIRELKQLPKDMVDNLLRQAVEQARPNATELLIRCYGDVNQLSSEGIPLMHTLMQNQRFFDFETRVLPIFRALQKAPGFKSRQQDANGNTWIMVLFRYANDNNKYVEDILLEDKGVHINHRNRLGESALDILIQGNKPNLLLQSLIRFDGYKAGSVDSNAFLDFFEQHKDNPAIDQAKFLEYYNYTMEQNTYVGYAEIMRKHTRKTPKEGWLRIEGTDSGVLYLSPEVQQEILDTNGRINNTISYGSRTVTLFSIAENVEVTGNKIFVKDDPELPGFEFAVFSFKKMLFNSGATYTELFKFKDKINKEFPVLFSQNAPGNNIQQKLSDYKKTNYIPSCATSLDNYHFSGMALCAMFLNPEDDKPDNFKTAQFLTPTGHDNILTCFDNDHSFVEGVLNGKLQVKTIIFCFDEMLKSFDPDFIEEFLTKTEHPEEFIAQWLQGCEHQFQLYRALFGDSRPFPIPVTPEIASNILRKIKLARKAFLKNPQIIKMDLLKILEPHVWQHYVQAHSESHDPFERFNKITKGLYRKHLGSLATKLNSVALLESVAISKAVLIDPVEALKCSPGETLKQMKTMVNDDIEVKNIMHDIIHNCHFSPLESQKNDHIREQAINRLDFSVLPEKTQKALIASLKKKPICFKKLVLRKCTVLNASDLRGLRSILRASKDMNSISLMGCNDINQKIIDAIASACPNLIRLNINNTTIDTLDCSKFVHLKTLRIDNCVYLKKVNIESSQLKYLHAENCRVLVDLAYNSRIIRSINIKGCNALSRDSMANIILSGSLDNISMDDNHPDFNPRYLSLQAVNKHQWNAKILALVIRDGLLDLSGLQNLNDDDLIQIAQYSQISMVKGKPMPQLQRMDLRGISAPKKGLQYCLINMPNLQEVYLQNNVSALPDTPLIEVDMKTKNSVNSLSCDIEGNIRVTASHSKATLKAGPEEFIYKNSKKRFAYYQTLDNGDTLRILSKDVQILNGITKVPTHTAHHILATISLLKNIQVHTYNDDKYLLISGSWPTMNSGEFISADVKHNRLGPISLKSDWHKNYINTCKFGEEFAIVNPERICFYELPNIDNLLRTYSGDQPIIKAIKIDETNMAVLHQHKLCYVDAFSCKVFEVWYGPNHKEDRVEFSGITKGPAGKLCVWDTKGLLYTFEVDHNYIEIHQLYGTKIDRLTFDNKGNIIASAQKSNTNIAVKLQTESVTLKTADLVATLKQMAISYVLPGIYLTPNTELANSSTLVQSLEQVRDSLGAIVDAHVMCDMPSENWGYIAIFTADHVVSIHQFLQQLRGTPVNKMNCNNSCVSLLGLPIYEESLLLFSQQATNMSQLIHLQDTFVNLEVICNLLTNNKFLTHISVRANSEVNSSASHSSDRNSDQLTTASKDYAKGFDLSFRFQFSQLLLEQTSKNSLCIHYAFNENTEDKAAFERFLEQFFDNATWGTNKVVLDNLSESDLRSVLSVFKLFEQQSIQHHAEPQNDIKRSSVGKLIAHPIYASNGNTRTEVDAAMPLEHIVMKLN